MNLKQLTDAIYYVGVNDRHSQLFESLWDLPTGISYNSYIVKGSMKTALIDACNTADAHRLIANILAITGGGAPDYLVVNHAEPDHSGALRAIRERFPDIVIVGNTTTLDIISGFYGLNGPCFTVSDNYTLDLGDRTLRFILTPMLHWPETMMTYVVEDRVLFSGDAFGCYGALPGAVADRDMDISQYEPELYRYYATIVGKYGSAVQNAIKRVKAIDIEYLCPTHGAVWHQQASHVIDIYNRLSRYEAEDGAVVVYGSMYGNTALMAETIAERLAERGLRDIKIHNAARCPLAVILSDIFRYRGLIIGAPTYSGTLFPPIMAVAQAINTRELRNRILAIFGTYSWASRAINELYSLLDESRMPLACSPVEVRQAPSPTDLAECRILADNVANALGRR